MSAKTLLAVIVLVIIVVAGVLLIYDKLDDDQSAVSKLAESMVKEKKPDWWPEPSESGLTRIDYANEYASIIDWEKGMVEVRAVGSVSADQADNLGQARSRSERIARMRAYEKLAETLDGLRLTSTARLIDETKLNSELTTSVQAFIQGAREKSVQPVILADGTPQTIVTLEIPLKGVGALYELTVKPAKRLAKVEAESRPRVPVEPEAAVEEPPEAVPEEAEVEEPVEEPAETEMVTEEPEIYSGGLIIDAEGLDLMPAMYPRVVDETGRTIYDVTFADESKVIEHGTVHYRNTISKAKELPDIGSNPLIIKAVGVYGTLSADVVISAEDGDKIIQFNEESGCLKKAAVVFIIPNGKK